MNSREKVILDKIIVNNISVDEQKSALVFHTILFILGWVTGVVDFSNFYSDIPAIIQLAIFVLIVIFPFITLISSFKKAKKNERINFILAYILLSSISLKKLLISFAFVIVAYVAAYTILKEFFDIVYYDIQYYFSIVIIFVIELLYHKKMMTFFNYIYGDKGE